MKLAKSFALIGVAGMGSASFAADAPSLTDMLASSGITASGYVSGTYEHFSGTPTYRQFDVDKNSFVFHQAGLTLGYQPKDGFGGVVQLMAGSDAAIVSAAEGSSGSEFEVLQAYAQYASGPWTVIAGKYLTLVGAEVIAPTGNVNISRSFTFFAEPLTHTGVRATFAATDKVNLFFGVNNGWNIVHDNNTAKTVELGASFAPSKAFSFSLQGYSGKEPVDTDIDGTRTIVDFVGSWYATDALTIQLNYDWGRQSGVPNGGNSTTSLKWNTGALYVNYLINPTWRVSLRVEQLDDKDGFMTGGTQKLKEGTLTVGWMPSKNFELRLEGRYDTSNEDSFLKDVDLNNETIRFDDKQNSVALEALFKF
jgi:hypothetical protein